MTALQQPVAFEDAVRFFHASEFRGTRDLFMEAAAGP
jgi:hypothetical protein